MITLHIGGQIYDGWKTASVKRAINAFASSFTLTVSDYKSPRQIPLDAPCQIFVDGVPVVTGYIDEVNPSYSADSHDLTFSGRSKTGDLVDCAAIFDTGQIMGSDIASIIRKIIAPFGIKLTFDAQGAFPVTNFQLQQGETCTSVIEKLCAMYGLVFLDDAEGNLVISRVSIGPSASTLYHKASGSEYNNILSGACTYSRRDRFSIYIVKSQMSGAEMDGDGEPATEGSAIDNEIPRYRPILLIAESAMDAGKAKTRAEWEKSTRAGNSIALDYMVQGWLNGSGKLWTPNSFVSVDDDFIRINGKLIVSEVSLNFSDSAGTTTALRIAPPDTFIPSSAGQEVKTFDGWEELRHGVEREQ